MLLGKSYSRLTITMPLLVFTGLVHGEVPQSCIDRFQANDAIPGDASCEVLSLTSSAGLSNFGCTGTAGNQIIEEYCGLVENENEECQFGSYTPAVIDTGSVEFTVDPSSSLFATGLLQFFLFTNVGLIGTSSDAQTYDSTEVLATIFGLSLPILATRDELASQYLADFEPGPRSISTEFCP